MTLISVFRSQFQSKQAYNYVFLFFFHSYLTRRNIISGKCKSWVVELTTGRSSWHTVAIVRIESICNETITNRQLFHKIYITNISIYYLGGKSSSSNCLEQKYQNRNNSLYSRSLSIGGFNFFVNYANAWNEVCDIKLSTFTFKEYTTTRVLATNDLHVGVDAALNSSIIHAEDGELVKVNR